MQNKPPSSLYIGLMSGTSLDGVDAVITDFSTEKTSLIASHFLAYPRELLASIKEISQGSLLSFDQLGLADANLGIFYAEVINQLLARSNISASQITAIGSHGQTIQHSPLSSTPYTLQIGDPNRLSELTGITVVADFRRKDIAAGGQGAPLVPAFQQAAFSLKHANRAVLNIGGIANITFLPSNSQQDVTGFDCGPGNTLMNQWCQKHFNCEYDSNGLLAKSGAPDKTLLKQLLADSYFQRQAPKSTGPEYFNLDWLETFDLNLKEPIDILATLCELTAKSAADCINQLPNLADALICGGGIHNNYLLERIAAYSKITIASTENHGIHPDWVEALAFAWLAKRRVEKLPGNIPSVTGAKRELILGAIYAA